MADCNLEAESGLEELLLHNEELEEFYCVDATISDVPDHVYKEVENPLESLRAYYKQNRQRAFEAKLLLLGDAEVGKSSLRDKLIEPNSPLIQRDATHAIELKTWLFPYAYADSVEWKESEQAEFDGNFRATIYDFGGQDILKATHKHFFSEASVYVLMLTYRTAANQSADWWYKWLHSIQYYGGKDSRIFILFNDKEGAGVRPELPTTVKTHFGIGNEQILYTNLQNNEGLDHIIAQLQESLQKLPHVGRRYPKSLLEIRKELPQWAKVAPIVSVEDFEAKCQHNKAQDQKEMAEWLNNLGDLFYFTQPNLNDWVVLEKSWLIDAVYEIFWDKHTQNQLGQFSKDDFYQLLRKNTKWENRYERYKMEYLLGIMERYGIVYKSNDSKNGEPIYISPSFSPINPPNSYLPLWERSSDKSKLYRFKLDFTEFMPLGMIALLMARNAKYIHRQEQWRNGVVLEWPLPNDSGLHLVELVENRENRKQELSITVLSDKKADVFAAVYSKVLVEQLGELDPQKQLAKKERIACNCSECAIDPEPHHFDNEQLEKAKGKKRSEVECAKSYEMVNIDSLRLNLNLLPQHNHRIDIKQQLPYISKLRDEVNVIYYLEKGLAQDNHLSFSKNEDYNDAVLNFCKALEAEMKGLFAVFKNRLQAANYTDADNQKTMLYKHISSKFLSLGDMRIVLEGLKLKESSPAGLKTIQEDARRELFLLYQCDNIHNNSSSKLDAFVTALAAFEGTKYRNNTAHAGDKSNTFNKADADDCKSKVYALLKQLIDASK